MHPVIHLCGRRSGLQWEYRSGGWSMAWLSGQGSRRKNIEKVEKRRFEVDSCG
jgi:hypothetical protein